MKQLFIRRNRRVLVIDDNSNIHDDFRKIFNLQAESETALSASEAALFGAASKVRESFEMDSAYQGEEALGMVERALAEARPYAVAFVDMRMPPGWDGVETIGRIWQADPQLQIVVCTAYSDYSWEAMSERLDLGDRLLILKKPFDNIEAYQLASALTAKWQMTQEAIQRISGLEDAVAARTLELTKANEALQSQVVERRLLEGRLVTAQKLESIGQLAAGIAHEINTPIQFIGDSVEFLRSAFGDLNTVLEQYRQAVSEFAGAPVDASTPRPAQAADLGAATLARIKAAEEAADVEFLRTEIPRAFDRTTDGVQRVTGIVRAMREFAHRGGDERRPADLNHAIESTLVVARNEYKYIADVVTELAELPPVTCNIGELNQVFLNLIVNAAHAIQESGRDILEGKITIRSAVAGDEVQITIGDNGCGIAAANADKIFDPFFTTKKVGRGTGQGLAIAYDIIVTKHGGSLSFESQIGIGTTFLIRLPVGTR